MPLAIFRCPSDTGNPLLSTSGVYAVKYSGSSFAGVKTNYDFCAYEGTYVCNAWKTQAPTARRMFGENSNTRRVMITDGTSNTIALAETTYDVYTATAPPGAIAAGAGSATDPGQGINRWDLRHRRFRAAVRPPRQLGPYGQYALRRRQTACSPTAPCASSAKPPTSRC